MMLPPVITSKTNERVKALREGFRGKASRPGELVGIEGITLLREAAVSGLEITAVFVQRDDDPEVYAAAPGAPRHLLTPDVFRSAVDTPSPQGVAALVRIPSEPGLRPKDVRGTALLLESVQDPGNVGTLVRSAEAFGAEAVFVTGETANAWSPKVVRASAGSVFRIPVVRLPTFEPLRESGLAIYAAVVRADDAENALLAKLRIPAVLMVGNEGAGLSARALEDATDRLWIPCATESLNAGIAGSLLLYEAMRQRGQGGAA